MNILLSTPPLPVLFPASGRNLNVACLSPAVTFFRGGAVVRFDDVIPCRVVKIPGLEVVGSAYEDDVPAVSGVMRSTMQGPACRFCTLPHGLFACLTRVWTVSSADIDNGWVRSCLPDTASGVN